MKFHACLASFYLSCVVREIMGITLYIILCIHCISIVQLSIITFLLHTIINIIVFKIYLKIIYNTINTGDVFSRRHR